MSLSTELTRSSAVFYSSHHWVLPHMGVLQVIFIQTYSRDNNNKHIRPTKYSQTHRLDRIHIQ